MGPRLPSIPLSPLLLALQASGAPRTIQARALAEAGCPPLQAVNLLRTPKDDLATLAALGAYALLGGCGGRESTYLLAEQLGIHPLSFPLAAPPLGHPEGNLGSFGMAGDFAVELEHPPGEPGPVLTILGQTRFRGLAIPDRCQVVADPDQPCILHAAVFAGFAKLTGCVTPG